MSAFHEVLFPLAFALGSQGGPERRTEITQLASGREFRNTPWAQSRRRWDVGGSSLTLDDVAVLTEFFEARRGRLHGFRFRDATDWKSCKPSGSVSASDQTLGVGDGAQTVFQLSKSYGATNAYIRTIAKPVAASVVVSLDGSDVSSGWSVDTTNGAITFDAPPASGVIVRAGFQFDTPARFDTDNLQTSLDAFQAGRTLSIPIIEIQP
ncbi:MAG: DUF2460 domain-containing protein [Pseudomonadota bacterium]